MSTPGDHPYLEDCDEEILDSYLYGQLSFPARPDDPPPP